jgi:hypothetical protein
LSNKEEAANWAAKAKSMRLAIENAIGKALETPDDLSLYDKLVYFAHG